MSFQEQLFALLQTLLIGLLNIGVGYVLYLAKIYIAKLQAQVSKIKNEDKQQLAKATLERLENLVMKSVVATEETVGKAMKSALADGKIDKNEILALSIQVRDEVYSQLSEESKVILNEEVGDIQLYIEKVIENALKDIKSK